MSRFTDFLDIYLEGEQAEEYKRRKAEEAENKKKEEDERHKRRYDDTFWGPGSQQTEKSPKSNRLTKTLKKENDGRRWSKTGDVIDKYTSNTGRDLSIDRKESDTASDSVNRHLRRHPDQYDKASYPKDKFTKMAYEYAKKESTIWENMFI